MTDKQETDKFEIMLWSDVQSGDVIFMDGKEWTLAHVIPTSFDDLTKWGVKVKSDSTRESIFLRNDSRVAVKVRKPPVCEIVYREYEYVIFSYDGAEVNIPWGAYINAKVEYGKK